MILGAVGDPAEALIPEFPRLRALGVNLVSIYLYTYMKDFQGTTVSLNGPGSTSDPVLVRITQAAHNAGLGVKYSPVIRMRNDPSYWRGSIKPTNVAAWFASYGKMIQHYMTIAKANHVEVFSIGSELNSMNVYTPQWQALAKQANSGYAGLTTYMTTPLEMLKVKWWASLDLISGSPYYSLSGKPGASVSSMVYVWQHSALPQLKSLSTKFRRPLLMAEIGYASVVGAAVRPAWGDRLGKTASETEQANAYRALLISAVRGTESWMRGIIWWNYAFSKLPSAIDRSFTFRDKKAECVIADRWSPHSLPRLVALGVVPTACVAANL